MANASQAFRSTWGWSDTQCTSRFPFMCKLMGEAAEEVEAVHLN